MDDMHTDTPVLVAVLDTRLSQIEGKLDKALDDHEKRLRKLEGWMYALPATVFASGASLIVALVK